MIRLLLLALSLVSLSSFAGRPVFHDLTRTELIQRSGFIFSGWPSHDKGPSSCKSEAGRWQVHHVWKGDRSYENKVISIAPHSYAIMEAVKKVPGSTGPSYPAYRYGKGKLDLEQGTSYLFTNQRSDGCFELAAVGAQESRMKAPEIEALLSDPKDCEKALRGFEFRAEKMPKSCTKDSDCKLYYAHPNSCARPYVWNKDAEKEIDESFQSLQSRVRSACADAWSGHPACEPNVYPFRCFKKECTAGLEAEVVKTKLQSAELSPTCAPHDASAMGIQVTDGKNEFPTLSINWWGEGKPNTNGGVFKVSGEGKMENGFLASYCTHRGGCEALKDVDIKLDWKKNDGTLDYSFHTKDGEAISGKVPVKYKTPKDRVICG